MAVSVFDLFKVGIGPSSSHTVGPMRAANLFLRRLQSAGKLASVHRVACHLYGSLGATGRGHGSDTAVLLGLSGFEPDSVPVEAIPALLAEIRQTSRLKLAAAWNETGSGAGPEISFLGATDLLLLKRESLPFHPNGMRLSAWDAQGQVLEQRDYYSVGGGFVVSDELAADGSRQRRIAPDASRLPLPFSSGAELLALCQSEQLSIAGVMRRNEQVWRSEAEIQQGLLSIWQVMQSCVNRGCHEEGYLPGGFKVQRRAAQLLRKLCQLPVDAPAPPMAQVVLSARLSDDPMRLLDWVNLFALAVNEENAAGGRVVTAPTNGAAGIIPAVLHYYWHFVPGAGAAGVVDFLLTAGAIGLLYKENASISGAEVGCQGEVGVACSMAAAGLAAVLGGTPEQVEHAAEIGMEHHLGLTCDPVGGLVQIPCIERNAIASVQALNAARMSLNGNGEHRVSLDQVIRTMRQTGADMKTKYKETARGGLAVNIIEC